MSERHRMLSKPLLTTEEVAELLKVKEATVRGWIRRGELKGIHIGREWRVAVRNLEEFVAAGVQAETASRQPAGRAGGDPSNLAQSSQPGTGVPTAALSPQAPAAGRDREASAAGPDLLVHIQGAKPWTESVDVGLRLARHLAGRAHGLLTISDAAGFKAHSSPEQASIAKRHDEWKERAAEIEARFEKARMSNGVEGNWLVGEGDGSELLALTGRVHDIAVVEQSDPDADERTTGAVEDALLGSGVPTLVVPSRGTFPAVGRRIVVAWNQSREAAMAVHGALPLLRRAELVVVLNGRRKEAFASITRTPALSIAAHLRRKGVAVEEVAFSASEEKAGSAILNAARQQGADMLVMGANGRSWFREWVLGNVTRHVLRHMDVPVLMMH